MTTNLNLLSQQKVDSEHEAEVSVQRETFNYVLCWQSALFHITHMKAF